MPGLDWWLIKVPLALLPEIVELVKVLRTRDAKEARRLLVEAAIEAKRIPETKRRGG